MRHCTDTKYSKPPSQVPHNNYPTLVRNEKSRKTTLQNHKQRDDRDNDCDLGLS